MLLLVLLATTVVVCNAAAAIDGALYQNLEDNINGVKQLQDVLGIEDIDTKNVISVPNNCRPGQEFINGQCRDVWRQGSIVPQNVVTVPPNCPPGQEFINGKCRDVWNKQHKIPLESEILAVLRNSFKRIVREAEENSVPIPIDINRNIISVPNQCPSGSRPDGLGICRPIFGF